MDTVTKHYRMRETLCMQRNLVLSVYTRKLQTSGVGSNLQVEGGAQCQRECAGRKFFDVPPHFSLVPPT